MTETYSFFKFLEVAAGLLCCLSLNGHEEKIVERVSHLDCPAIMAMSIVAPENQLCILERKSIELISESRQGSTVVVSNAENFLASSTALSMPDPILSRKSLCELYRFPFAVPPRRSYTTVIEPSTEGPGDKLPTAVHPERDTPPTPSTWTREECATSIQDNQSRSVASIAFSTNNSTESESISPPEEPQYRYEILLQYSLRIISQEENVIRLIGRGGNGAVVEIHGEDGRRLAGKVGYDLSTEAMLLRALQHPLVVKYYDFVEPLEIRRFGFGLLLTELYGCEWNSKNPLIADETGLPPIMDPFHPGNHQRSLQQLIETYTQVPMEVQKLLIVQIFIVLEFLHKNGVAHRDIKPSNILVASNLIVKLIDFGCAATIPQHDQSWTGEVGTPVYQAPEIKKGQPWTGKPQDVWAAGVILAEMIFGGHIFMCEDDILEFEVCKIKYFLDDDDCRYKLLCGLLEPNPGLRMQLDEALTCPWLQDKVTEVRDWVYINQ